MPVRDILSRSLGFPLRFLVDIFIVPFQDDMELRFRHSGIAMPDLNAVFYLSSAVPAKERPMLQLEWKLTWNFLLWSLDNCPHGQHVETRIRMPLYMDQATA